LIQEFYPTRDNNSSHEPSWFELILL